MSNILDKMTSSRKSVPLSSSSGKQNKGPVLKPLAPRPKTKVLPLQKQTAFLVNNLVQFGDTYIAAKYCNMYQYQMFLAGGECLAGIHL